MYEARQNKEKVSRAIVGEGCKAQQRVKDDNKNIGIIQRRLTSINNGKLDVYNYEDKNDKDADITNINNNSYEEIQVIYSNKGFIIYGKIEKNDLPDQNAIIICVKTRIIDNYNNVDAESPFYGTNKNPVYYDTTNTKSAEIAFSNKMSLRGYLILERAETDQLAGQEINPVPMDKKGEGLSTMNRKPWYYPKKGETFKFADYDRNKALKNISEWKSYENAPFIQEKVKRIEPLINKYELSVGKADNTNEESINLLKQKGVLTNNLEWTVKNENSLKKRLYHKPKGLIKINKSKIVGKINVYDDKNDNRYVRNRNVDELKGKIISEIDANENEYQWSTTSIDELGDRYKEVKDQRSKKEWLEILHLWEESMGIESIVKNWRKTARLHLDSSGLEKEETNTVKYEGLFKEKLKSHNFIRDDGTWVAKTIRDLGDHYANLGDNKQLEWQDVLKAWNETHHTKVEYNLDKKFNNWTQGTTEWGVNSTTNIDASNETPFAGWSKFNYSENPNSIMNFHNIRKAEIPHKHPIQTEIYKINQGTAFLMIDGNIENVEKGQNKIIPPETPHCIVAIKPPYEHIVIQSPSGFHQENNKEKTGEDNDMESFFQKVREQQQNPSV